MDLAHFFTHLFDRDGFLARWECGGFTEEKFTGLLMLGSDLAIFGAYMTIPLLLLYFVKKRQDMAFTRVIWLFAAFIFACGISHLLDALMFEWPIYRFNALERLLTAVISWTTVIALVPIIPKALSLKTAGELEREITERRLAEQRLRDLNDNLEHIVALRTMDLELQKRQLEAANRELESFSYSVSHDLKAPLRKISQFSQVLRTRHGERLDDQARDYLTRIEKNGRQMYELVDDLLSFSKISRTELRRQPINLSELARLIVSELREDEPDRSVIVEIQPGMALEGDPNMIRLSLQNLLSNAWKYTSIRKQAVIEVGEATGNEQSQVFFARDNGIGFEMRKSERLFAPFFRLHREEQFPGSGIGLANVQRAIHRQGGKVWAESKPDKGATFFFSIPRKPG